MERVETNLLHLSRVILLSGKLPGSAAVAAAARRGGAAALARTGMRGAATARDQGGRLALTFTKSSKQVCIGFGSGALITFALFQDSTSEAQCAAAQNNKADDDDDEVGKLIDKWTPAGGLGGEVTFGALVGFSSGYALKKIGKATAFIIGCGFIAAQGLAYTGYLQVNWRKVEQQVVTLIDQDGDRKLTKKDLLVVWKKVKKVLVHQLPSTGGFATGFALGFYKG